MKRITLYTFIMISSINMLLGQSVTLKQVVLPTQGAHYRVGNTALSWTLGEPVGKTLNNGSLILTQGIQQPEVLTFRNVYIDIKNSCFSKLTAIGIPSSFNDSLKLLTISKADIIDSTITVSNSATSGLNKQLSLKLNSKKNISNVYVLSNAKSTTLPASNYEMVGDNKIKLLCEGANSGTATPKIYVKIYQGVVVKPFNPLGNKLEVIGAKSSDVVLLTIKNSSEEVVFTSSSPLALNWDGSTGGCIKTGRYEYQLEVNGIQYNGKFLIDDVY